MTEWSTQSMMPEKSDTPLYRVSPMVLPRRLDRHRPSTNARTTADSVFMRVGISRLKYGSSELPAVAAILSSASALMKCGNRVSDTKNEAEPAMRVEQ